MNRHQLMKQCVVALAFSSSLCSLWCVPFIPYIYCIDLFNFIYLPILVYIINVIILCLNKEPFKKYYLLIYLLFVVLISILKFITLPILVRISIIIILMCHFNV